MKSFEETYRQWLEEHLLESVSGQEAAQLNDSWDTIEEELVLDAVWTNLDATLPGGRDIAPEGPGSPSRPSIFTYLGIPAGAILVGLALWYVVSGDRSAPHASSVLSTREDPAPVEKGPAAQTLESDPPSAEPSAAPSATPSVAPSAAQSTVPAAAPTSAPTATPSTASPAAPSAAPEEESAYADQQDVPAELADNPGQALASREAISISENPGERILQISSETNESYAPAHADHAQTIRPANERISIPPADTPVSVPPSDKTVSNQPADTPVSVPLSDKTVSDQPAGTPVSVPPADDRISIRPGRNLTVNHIGGIHRNTIGMVPDSFLRTETAGSDIRGRSAGLSSLNNWYFRGFGFVASYKNSWILNDETLAGLDPGTLTNTRVSFAPDLGVTALMASRKGHQLELELLLLSRQRQQYSQYINALYQDRTITLSYQKAQLNWYIPPKFIPGHLGIGIYGAHLGTARETVGGEIRAIDGFYRTFDYGVSIDYKLEYRLLPHFVLAPSLRLQYSLPDIFTGSPSVPGVLRRTHNASAGINVVIFYRF